MPGAVRSASERSARPPSPRLRRTGRPDRPAATEETPCNLCGVSRHVVVGTRDRDGGPLRTVLCTDCGLVWTNPRPTAAAMNAYYESSYRADYTGHRAPSLRKIVRGFRGAADRRRILRQFLAPAQRVPDAAMHMLDVGCGAGELVYLMRRDGIDASGLEPGIEFADFARAVLDVPIQTAAVDAARMPAESQDVVTMFHALEHVPDPLSLLTTVRTWIRHGGHLVVEVPNIAACVQAPNHQFHYAHLHHFTGGTLAAMGEAAGLRARETRYTSDRGNVICVFQRDGDGRRPPAGLHAEAASTLAALRSHTAPRHYLSRVPYLRAAGRLRQRLAEDRLLRGIKTVEDALRWADSLT
jgi:2-polyprenyl-3-methyl-5-hydroxy-6-metoxy-1,4-benzoquinol methylase